jgi:acetyl esterase/lipase
MLLSMGAAHAETQAPNAGLPETLSPQWRGFYARMEEMFSKGGGFPAAPAAGDLAGWKKFHDGASAMMKTMGEPVIKQLAPRLNTRSINGVPVLEVEPRGYRPSKQVIIYTHGGGYTIGTADSSAASAALIADASGLRVVSVDYTTAPFAKFEQVTDQVVAVFKGLVAEGHPLKSTAIYGDSAGGGLAMASVLKLRDQGAGMPAAVVLWSPWVDLTESGDTNLTLRASDPILRGFEGRSNASAYADAKDMKNPYASPVYGDFSKGYPPTLIQAGTRELLLSDAVRAYQALDRAHRTVRLDVYEAMPHVFQALLPESDESRMAIRKTVRFFKENLQ